VAVGRWLTVALVIALLVGGGYAAFLGLTGGSANSAASNLPACSRLSHLPKLPKSLTRTQQFKVTVDNATLRTGLAARVAAELKHRGFPIGAIGNTPTTGKGIATVRYSPNRKVEAQLLAAQIANSTTVAVGGRGVVELDIDPKFRVLASRGAARAAERLAILGSLPHTSPTPTPSPTCRPT